MLGMRRMCRQTQKVVGKFVFRLVLYPVGKLNILREYVELWVCVGNGGFNIEVDAHDTTQKNTAK